MIIVYKLFWMKHLLNSTWAVIAFVLLSTSVSWSDDLYLCDMTKFLRIANSGKVMALPNQSFNFKDEDGLITFGKNSHNFIRINKQLGIKGGEH